MKNDRTMLVFVASPSNSSHRIVTVELFQCYLFPHKYKYCKVSNKTYTRRHQATSTAALNIHLESYSENSQCSYFICLPAPLSLLHHSSGSPRTRYFIFQLCESFVLFLMLLFAVHCSLSLSHPLGGC